MATKRKTTATKQVKTEQVKPERVKPEPVKPEQAKQSDEVIVKYKSMHSIQFELNGKPVKINGSNEDLRGKPSGVLVTDYGTTILARQTWEAVEKKYGSMSIFKNGLIFAYAQPASAEARAKENAGLDAGFAPK